MVYFTTNIAVRNLNIFLMVFFLCVTIALVSCESPMTEAILTLRPMGEKTVSRDLKGELSKITFSAFLGINGA